MNEFLNAALKLHDFMTNNHWTGEALIGPDQGVRFNRRFGRYVKSILPFLPWKDQAYYLQAQAYWVLSNWILYDICADQKYADFAVNCTTGILKTQRPEGYWDYPHSGWEGRIATVEVVWAAIGLLASYERTKNAEFLLGALKTYEFLITKTSFQQYGDGLAINYFADQGNRFVPNNSTLALPFFAKLAQATDDKYYVKYCGELITFLSSVQLESGEFPYEIKPSGRSQTHYQCFQYNAFELQDLSMYYEISNDKNVLPLIQKTCKFLSTSIAKDGSTRFDCPGHDIHIVYNTAAIVAALGISRRLGLQIDIENENRAYSYLLAQQQPSGGFPFSTREYTVLRDKRFYPRPMSMILYHLLLKVKETNSIHNQN
jgi:hypothetical protein